MIVVLSKNANDPYARWSQFRADAALVGRRGRPAPAREAALLSDGPAAGPGQAAALAPPADLVGDQPRDLGRPGARARSASASSRRCSTGSTGAGSSSIVGGAGPAFAPLRESFLAAYLPAEPSGENVMRPAPSSKPLSRRLPARRRPRYDPDDPMASNISWTEAWEKFGRRYKAPAPIPATDKKPCSSPALNAKPGATVIPLGGPDDPPLGVEWRVGRGRVLMLAVGLTDPDLVGWPGFDTLVRRVVLRRPEERLLNQLGRDPNGGIVPPRYESLGRPRPDRRPLPLPRPRGPDPAGGRRGRSARRHDRLLAPTGRRTSPSSRSPSASGSTRPRCPA